MSCGTFYTLCRAAENSSFYALQRQNIHGPSQIVPYYVFHPCLNLWMLSLFPGCFSNTKQCCRENHEHIFACSKKCSVCVTEIDKLWHKMVPIYNSIIKHFYIQGTALQYFLYMFPALVATMMIRQVDCEERQLRD